MNEAGNGSRFDFLGQGHEFLLIEIASGVAMPIFRHAKFLQGLLDDEAPRRRFDDINRARNPTIQGKNFSRAGLFDKAMPLEIMRQLFCV